MTKPRSSRLLPCGCAAEMVQLAGLFRWEIIQISSRNGLQFKKLCEIAYERLRGGYDKVYKTRVKHKREDALGFYSNDLHFSKRNAGVSFLSGKIFNKTKAF